MGRFEGKAGGEPLLTLRDTPDNPVPPAAP